MATLSQENNAEFNWWHDLFNFSWSNLCCVLFPKLNVDHKSSERKQYSLIMLWQKSEKKSGGTKRKPCKQKADKKHFQGGLLDNPNKFRKCCSIILARWQTCILLLKAKRSGYIFKSSKMFLGDNTKRYKLSTDFCE